MKSLAYELDSWLNFTKWHAVLSKSKHDLLRTYDFLRYKHPRKHGFDACSVPGTSSELGHSTP